MARVIFLAGAPHSESLSWDEASLTQDFQPEVRRFLGENGLPSTASSFVSTSFILPKWRIVSYHNPVEEHTPPLVNLPMTSSQAGAEADLDHLDFLEYSLAQVDAEETTLISFTTITEDTSTTSFASTIHSLSPSPSIVHSTPVSPTPPLTDLSHLPSASTLTSLHPQTPTINLLAAVIQPSLPRTVHLRRHVHTTKQIIEILLGDDTRSNFSVTFWFPTGQTSTMRQRTSSSSEEVEALRARVLALRPGDVVLMRNVALTQWRGVVYGCSLQRWVTRSSSKVAVVGEREALVPAAVQRKLDRVQRFRDEFVGRGHMCEEGQDSANDDGIVGEDLPIDETQIGRS